MPQNFPLSTGGYDLLARTPIKRGSNGWDTVALQRALLSLAYRLPRGGADGYFGDETDAALKLYQSQATLFVDGRAGPLTQYAISERLADLYGIKAVPHLSIGCIEKESSGYLGEYTPTYDDGSRDFGVCQDNRDDAFEDRQFGFNPQQLIAYHASYVADYQHTFYGRVGAKTVRRSWELGVLAWHRPAWAYTLANGGILTLDQQLRASDYIVKCFKYVAWA